MIGQLKNYVKARFPLLVNIVRWVKGIPVSKKSPKFVFTKIYDRNEWKDADSLSGPGSNLEYTESIRDYLPQLISDLDTKSLLDVPCGDFYWMNHVDLDITYIGGDIVKEIIESNNKLYKKDNRSFIVLDLIQDTLPKVDMILCRDCFVHFSYKHIFSSLENIKASNSKYLLATTFTEVKRNDDIPTGLWRPLNLQLPPFNFPEPMELMNENWPTEDFQDKHLGLWRIEEIPS